MASGLHAGELGTALVSGTEVQEGRKVLEAGQACSVGHPGLKTACAACGRGTEGMGTCCQSVVTQGCAHLLPALAPHCSTHLNPAYLYRGCSDVSEGDRSGMEREVDDRVVAMEAVVASSKDGGVQGRRSGRPSSSSVG